ncbi:MAG: helix-turn-helix transcriptional regulator [Cytophagales bacterium]|nr:helix-turn-helix transcriptional regulator [Cytophaga sp.]
MNIFIGELIKSVAERRGISKSEMARRLNMSATNVHKIFKRQSIDTDLLSRICTLLEYDFFLHYISKKPANYLEMTKDAGIPLHLVSETEEKYPMELNNCKEKVKMLQRINDLLEDKIKTFVNK